MQQDTIITTEIELRSATKFTKEYAMALIKALPAEWRAIIKNNLAALNEALKPLYGCDIDAIRPHPNIFAAFHMVLPQDVRVVLLGQDPYPNADYACGLSFSTSRELPTDSNYTCLAADKLPPSLRNIYKCWKSFGLTNYDILTGNIAHLTTQGVLLINAELTFVAGVKGTWSKFVSGVLNSIPNTTKPIRFILLGTRAQEFKKTLTHGALYEWGHPSPLNKVNNDATSPANFINCDIFKKIAADLGIVWCPYAYYSVKPILTMRAKMSAKLHIKDMQPKDIFKEDCVVKLISKFGTLDTKDTKDVQDIKDNVLYLFTDGGCIGNGRKTARASWAFCIAQPNTPIKDHRELILTEDCGEVCNKKTPATNNRGELSGILFGYKKLREMLLSGTSCTKVILVSDSQFALDCLSKWLTNWVKKGILKDKKNPDMMKELYDLEKDLKKLTKIEYLHVNSHESAPAQSDPGFFMWYFNNHVDRLCARILEHK